jgi:hypothetical protein
MLQWKRGIRAVGRGMPRREEKISGNPPGSAGCGQTPDSRMVSPCERRVSPEANVKLCQ